MSEDSVVKTGIAGTIARSFIRSKLTLLLVIGSILVGIYAVSVTPREEEPQIVVPMIDVFVSYLGASSQEVETKVTRPMAKLLWEIEGVEYVYTMSKPGMCIAIVRFYVGEDMEDSLVKLYNKLYSNFDMIPPGVSKPLVKPRSIDDVPILTFTLWSEKYSGFELRRVAFELADELKQDEDVSQVSVIGGQKRQIRITLDPVKMSAYGVSVTEIGGRLKAANFFLTSGEFPYDNTQYLVKTGGFIKSAEEVGDIVVKLHNGTPVYLKDVATVEDITEEPDQYVFMGFGPGADNSLAGHYEAVTITVAKKKGTNATHIAERLIEKVNVLKGDLIPQGVEVSITRNYGETAKEKSDELLKHMLIAALSVTVLIGLFLGGRVSIVVLVAIPVTLALTMFTTYLLGYTINRVTLFALIFSIGILVDDAIVVVENIYRHFAISFASPEVAVKAVDEVGNPTILATFTVIAALLPMAAVSGLMGPYMEPIPVGASSAMLVSLFVAFIVTPWMSNIVLKRMKKEQSGVADGGEHEEENRILKYTNRLYESNLRELINNPKKRMFFYLFVIILLVVAISLFLFKVVTVKMLPFDNKSELQIIIDMPEGTTLEETAIVSQEVGRYLQTVPEVTDYQLYIGTAAPFNFNGLVRHYFLRRGANVSDVQVNFLPKEERSLQSHDLAKKIRGGVSEIGEDLGARIKVVEVPPGPPVLSTLVAEVYGPNFEEQIAIAEKVRQIFEDTEGVVDVDWLVEDPQEELVFVVDKEKAAIQGISTQQISRVVSSILGGESIGLAHMEYEKEPVDIFMRAPISERAGIENLRQIRIKNHFGVSVPLSELVKVERRKIDKTIYGKNLKRVVYVIGEVSGREESPVYAILKMKEKINNLTTSTGEKIRQYFSRQPDDEELSYSLKWDGEWHITYEVFRDLGVAFLGVLVLIYIMVVGWFKSFVIPLVIMAPIPLSLIGIIPGHAIFGAFFTATSMIGFIAGAGIVVRNSIILVDFIELKLSEGMPLKKAIVEAGVIRFRPMLLTASAVVVGSSVILFDPIFQGMAISLMAGEVAATILSRTMVPVLYYECRKFFTAKG